MGKAVKAVAGIALVVASGGIAGALLGLTGTAALVASGAISLVGASLVGSALTPDAPDMDTSSGYAGQTLQTKKDNVSAVAQTYGEIRSGSNVIWQSSGSQISGNPNKDYWSIQAVSEGEIESFEEMYANEDTMSNLGSDKFTTTYAHIKGYPTSGAGGINLADVEFVTDSTGTTDTWSNINNSSPLGADDITVEGSFYYVNKEYLFGTTSSQALVFNTASGHTVTWDYGSTTVITSFNIFVRTYKWDGSPTLSDMRLQYHDGANWTDASNYVTSHGEYDVWKTFTLTEGISATHWRLYVGSATVNSNRPTITKMVVESEDLLDVYIPPNVSFIATHQVYEATDNAHTQLDSITALMQGKKIKTIVDDSTISSTATYSNNPSDIVLDILMNGLSVSESSIDIPSFYSTKTNCLSYGYTCNVSFNSQTNIQSVLSTVLATFRGYIVYSQGKWKLKMDEKNMESVKTLTNDDIINNSMNISMRGFSEIANNVVVRYINPDDNWLSAETLSYTDEDLVTNDGKDIEKILDIKAVTNTTQANKLAEIALNTMRYSEDASGNRIKQTPLSCVFATTVKNAELEVGDIISLDHDLLDRVRKFVILSVETDQSGVIQVSAREYAETHFKDSSNNYII